MIIDVELEEWRGDGRRAPSPVIRRRGRNYNRLTLDKYQDEPAQLKPRQAVFYRNLIRIAEKCKGREIPVDFELPNGTRWYLDHGCIKIAEHAAFIEPLENGPSGRVEHIRLAWGWPRD